jgi:3-oxoacyl-[acyl-carrier protein] reductase
MTLAGKVAIVTGASKGIGKSTALSLAAAGASVVVNYSSDDAAANHVVKTIGKKAIAFKADVSTISGIEALVRKTMEHFGRIDILIPNAGVMPMKDLEHTTEEDFNRTFALNVKGPYFLCQV